MCRSCLYNQSRLSSAEGLEVLHRESQSRLRPLYTSDATSVQDLSSPKGGWLCKRGTILSDISAFLRLKSQVSVFQLVLKYIHTFFLIFSVRKNTHFVMGPFSTVCVVAERHRISSNTGNFLICKFVFPLEEIVAKLCCAVVCDVSRLAR